MNDRRKEWMNSLVKFQYRVGSTWYDGDVGKKEISGDQMIYMVSFPRNTSSAETINAVRIIDVTGKQCAFQTVNIIRSKSQGVTTKFVFPLFETTSTS